MTIISYHLLTLRGWLHRGNVKMLRWPLRPEQLFLALDLGDAGPDVVKAADGDALARGTTKSSV